MFGVLGMSRPLLGKTNRAGKSDLAVDHENAPVRPTVCAIDAQGMRRMIIRELATGLLHHAHIGVVEVPARANSIQKDADLYAALGCFAERITKLPANRIGIQ